MLNETQIKKLNDKFKSLSKAEQRVLIARDVIAQVNKKKYKPSTGAYLTLVNNFYNHWSVQEHIDEIECRCCALGACLLSTTKFKNKLNFGDVDSLCSKSDSWKLLRGVFSHSQINMIEYAFEASHNGSRVGEDYFNDYAKFNYNKRAKCISFGRSFVYESDRIVAIMENIIKNKGTFKL